MRLRRAAYLVLALTAVVATVMWLSEAHATSHGYVTGLSVSNITTSSAELEITRNNLGGHNYTSHYRYKRSGGSYTNGSVQSTATTVSVTISGLSSGTNYTVQAAKAAFWLAGAQSASFTTLSGASLSSISVSDVAGVSATATATATLDNPDTLPVTVYLRYKHTSESTWTTSSGSATSTTVDFALSGLDYGRDYEVQASLSSEYTNTVSGAFTTDLIAPVCDETNNPPVDLGEIGISDGLALARQGSVPATVAGAPCVDSDSRSGVYLRFTVAAGDRPAR